MLHLLLHDLVPDLLAQRSEAAPVIDPGPFNKDQDRAGKRSRRRSRKRKCEKENDQQTHDGAHDAVSHTTTQNGDDAGALVREATTAVTGMIPTHAIGLTKTHPKQPAVSVNAVIFSVPHRLQYHQR